MDGQKTPIVDESIYSMNKDNNKDKKEDSRPMKNQLTVGDTDGNNSDVIMNDAGINTDLDADNRCYDDFKDTQPAPKKQNNTDGFEDISNTKKNDTIETND